MTKLPDDVRAAMERLDAKGEVIFTRSMHADWQTIRDYLVRQEANAARYVWLRSRWGKTITELAHHAHAKGPTSSEPDAAIDAAMLAAAAREG